MCPYFAHSGRDTQTYSDYQFLRDHLRQVAERAHNLAQDAIPQLPWLATLAHTAGLLHDLGKYRAGFQQHIRGLQIARELTFHKQAGAARSRECPLIALPIAGHHGGLPSCSSLEQIIGRRGKNEYGEAHLNEVRQEAIADCPELASLDFPKIPTRTPEESELLIRLIFSCLVDADWTDTGAYARCIHGLPPEDPPATLQAALWLSRVLGFIEGKAATCPDERMRTIRDEVLQSCLKAAESEPGIFSLTVPTGGGKTLSALAFALEQAVRHKLRRVIYVAPFLTILEQNAGVLAQAMGLAVDGPELFVHHSLAEPTAGIGQDETEQEAAARRAENWDAPVIVTTNVQFFESLFSNHPGRCRKVHNMARSVILLDECQALPPGLIAPTCGMLRQLASELGSTIVLCTATQPAFGHPTLGVNALKPREIIPAEANLFPRLQRVQLQWPTTRDERFGWDEVAQRMRRKHAALCVVNTRKAACELFQEISKQVDPQNCFHLSTSMCPAHRDEVLKEVRQRLRANRPCYLVSTQLIEAGVDVDFPAVFREMGPLDGIIQAAGRCNREGLLNGPNGEPGGRVEVFRSLEGKMPREWYLQGSQIVETSFLTAGNTPRIDDPNVILEYYTRLYYSGNIDGQGICSLRRQGDFPAIAEKYRLIEQDGIAVVVGTWEKRRDEIEALLAQVRAQPTRRNFRALRPFQVNLRSWERTQHQDVVGQVDARFDLWEWTGPYSPELGLAGERADTLLLV